MKNFRALLYLFALIAFASVAVAQPKVNWEIRSALGELEYDPSTSTISGSNGVTVIYGDVFLRADKVTANEQTGIATAEGHVSITTKDMTWAGDRATYNFKTGESDATNYKTGQPPYFIQGEGLAGDRTNRIYASVNSIMTSDDYADPAYKIRARELIIIPGEYIEARDATFFLGDVPVFYLPVYKRNLGRHQYNWVFNPGYRSLYGPYMLTTFNWYPSHVLNGAVHLDMRERRGFAGGPDFNYDAGKFGRGVIQTYYAHDLDPEDEPRYDIPHDRYFLTYEHIANPTTNLAVKAAINYQRDPFVIRDFFESRHRENAQPKSIAELTYLWPNWVFDTMVQPQINDFFETVERLPDIKLTGLRQQIGETPLYYESESSGAYLQRSFASTNRFQPDYAAFRGDTFHQVTLPRTYFNWLNITPRVGGRYTYYTEAHGPGSFTDEENRLVFNTGAETSFKASQVWNNAENKFFQIDGVRHIIEPSLNYVYVPRPNARPPELPQFDYELPSLRLLPIDFPDYNSIDSVDAQNVIRIALRNRLQTKRETRIDEFVKWALYTDWRLDPRTNQTSFSHLYSDLEIEPWPWMRLHSEVRYEMEQGRLTESNHRVTMEPNYTWSATFGHRYLDDDAFGFRRQGNNILFGAFTVRMNENWAGRISHYFDANDGRLAEQYYTIYRDLRSWTAALTFRHRDERTGRDDFTVGLTFSLKAFPRYGLGGDREQARYSDR